MLPRVRRETPALSRPETTGIDGVSLGGALALRIGFYNPKSFGALGALQPAISVDHYAYEGDVTHRYNGKNKEFIMGVLLALKPTFNIDTLKTIPGKILAKAFQDYGAYVVDDA